MVRIRLLGTVEVEQGGQRVRGFRSHKTLALLGYLAARGQPLARSHLADLFWPDETEAQGRLSLSRALNSLTTLLPGLLQADRNTLHLPRSEALWLDVAAFDRVAEGTPQALAEATALYRDDFMTDIALDGCPAFDLWLVGERELWRQRVAQVLNALVTHYAQHGAHDAALTWASRLLHLQPWQEEAHRHVMRLLAWSGQRSAALAQYETCRRVLAEELGVAPSPETVALYEQLRAGVLEQPRPIQRPHNLPLQPTPLLGREAELAHLMRRLAAPPCRLVTVVGPGGVGKTRLALEVAQALSDGELPHTAQSHSEIPNLHYPDGVFFVNLTPIRDADLVATTIARMLGVREEGRRPLIERLKDGVRGRQMLLLLDNFEHVMAAAPVVSELLAASADLKVLVTSREPLHLRGEQEFPVAPLAAPDLTQPAEVETLVRCPAVALFIQRVVAVRPDFELHAGNAHAVAEICARLDGLPLAIELAAARVKLLPPQAIVQRLGRRLTLLTGGPRDLPTRYQSLHGAIAWSYELLDDQEKMLFRRLSVFAGGVTLEAAEAVCCAGSDMTMGVLDGIASLVDKSLLKAVSPSPQDWGERGGPNAEPRFTMLETIREYALERLMDSGEAEAIRRQHTQFFVRLAEVAEPRLRGGDQIAWMDRLETEHANLRGALGWLLDGGGPAEEWKAEPALRLSGALSLFWEQRGHMSEGRRWLVAALAAAPPSPPLASVRAKALNGVGMLAWRQGDHGLATMFLEESLAICRELGDKRGMAEALRNLGNAAGFQEDYARATALYEQSLALAREAGASLLIAQATGNLGWALLVQGDYARARATLAAALALSRAVGDMRSVFIQLGFLANVLRLQGDYGRAGPLYAEALTMHHQAGEKWFTIQGLMGMASVAGARGEGVRAARLLGAAEALRQTLSAPLAADVHKIYEQGIALARALLDEASLARAWAEGQAMTLEEAIAYALEVAPTEQPMARYAGV